jgi:predicted metal-dependent HD superfamily phosphohydrolase
MSSKPGLYGIEKILGSAALHPAYWKTVARLRKNGATIAFEGAALRFTDYPFEPAAVFPAGVVSKERIGEVNLSDPPQLRLESGEILFAPYDGKDEFLRFVHRNDVQVRRRTSVWRALLDPFLDTWETQETIDRQFAWFAELGLDRASVDTWRREVAVAMVAYNFGTGLWEWGSLDLYDVLMAQHARSSRADFADFYSRAMQLAASDPLAPDGKFRGDRSIPDALFSVLIEWYPREQGGALKDVSKQWDQRTEQIKELQRTLSDQLAAAYSQPHRRYHAISHVEHCLQQLAEDWQYAVHPNEVRWALLFHDAVYDPRREDNEARSADWACRVMEELQRPEDEKARVRALIMATAHASEPRTADEALLLDIDLSILGAGEAAFDEYDRSIRAEYEWVPQEHYRQARARVLQSFLDRERIYSTVVYRQRYERPARANLQRALARLAPG